jgi:hypothetical protein
MLQSTAARSCGCATVVMALCAIWLNSWQSRRAARRVNQIESLVDSTISDMTGTLEQSSTSVEMQAALFIPSFSIWIK